MSITENKIYNIEESSIARTNNITIGKTNNTGDAKPRRKRFSYIYFKFRSSSSLVVPV